MSTESLGSNGKKPLLKTAVMKKTTIILVFISIKLISIFRLNFYYEKKYMVLKYSAEYLAT